MINITDVIVAISNYSSLIIKILCKFSCMRESLLNKLFSFSIIIVLKMFFLMFVWCFLVQTYA